MLENKQIDVKDLAFYGPVSTLNEQAKTLVLQQKATWKTASKNFDALHRIKTRDFKFDLVTIITQNNPERIRSSAAKTDAKSIAARPCFLCLKNLPEQQKGLIFQHKYLILANPFPIFPVHLTISNKNHTQQQLKPFFSDMLELSKSLNDFTVFYNGPQTGASAPDHFHFQAGIKNYMPIEAELTILEKNFSNIIYQTDKIKVCKINDGLRRFFLVKSVDKNKIVDAFNYLFDCFKSSDVEPMMNVLSMFENGQWKVMIFPREKQRPSHFFNAGVAQIITGPAAVELGGILVLPREEDFNKISKKEITEIYTEVGYNKEDFNKISFENYKPIK